MADSTGDRLIIAETCGVASRHLPLSGSYPHGETAAIAEVRAVARGQADLLADAVILAVPAELQRQRLSDD